MEKCQGWRWGLGLVFGGGRWAAGWAGCGLLVGTEVGCGLWIVGGWPLGLLGPTGWLPSPRKKMLLFYYFSV